MGEKGSIPLLWVGSGHWRTSAIGQKAVIRQILVRALLGSPTEAHKDTGFGVLLGVGTCEAKSLFAAGFGGNRLDTL
jgi:hypothetical protein